MNRSIEEINRIVDIVMTDSDVRDALNDRILAKNLEDLKLAKAREDGIEQGIEQGEKIEKIKIAKKMLDKKIDIETIIETTGLSEEEIKKIQEN